MMEENIEIFWSWFLSSPYKYVWLCTADKNVHSFIHVGKLLRLTLKGMDQ
jgi:hypothetical protein